LRQWLVEKRHHRSKAGPPGGRSAGGTTGDGEGGVAAGASCLWISYVFGGRGELLVDFLCFLRAELDLSGVLF